MIVTGEIPAVRVARWSNPTLSWGVVPTMGFLHEGHLSLVRRARVENDRVGASVFVNPTQFAPDEDLDTYPRSLAQDLELLAAEGVDLVFTPIPSTMYPEGFQTSVTVEELARPLEGASRPSHFQGVATVVAKLFNIFQPNRAYFGQKDAQQAAVIRQMVIDLDFYLEVVVCPIVREDDGLAMSSRNVKLNHEQRQAATVLYRALQAAAERLRQGETSGEKLRELMRRVVGAESLASLDYASVADPLSLLELDHVEGKALLSLAVFFDAVRLIDNVLVETPTTAGSKNQSRLERGK
jgi:pantoate--beta-alanine ligase